jgi:hypothetical protein
MPISMRCPGCQTRFDFADDLVDKRIKCKSCGDIFRVAGAAPARKARDDDDDDRPRTRRRDDEDDDRPSGRYRRPDREDDSDDELPRRRRYDDDDDRPRKRKHNPLLLLIPLGVVGLAAVVVVAIILARGDKKKGGGAGSGDVVVAPARSCPLEVAEKDVGQLVLPDSGTTFGLLRKSQAFRPSWSFEPYDLATGKAGKRIDLADVEEPKAWSLSPDGKNLLLTEARGQGAGEQWLWLWPLAGQRPRADKWFPYQRDDKRPFDAPALWRGEIVANDRVLTLATNRSFFIYSLPSFEWQTVAVAAVEKDGLGKRSWVPHDYQYRVQWEEAFTADRKQIAIWTGDGLTIANTADGSEVGGISGVRALARSEWGNTAGDPNRVKGGPAAFSPDGSTLAGVVMSDGGNKRLLCLWSVPDGALKNFYRIADNQWNDAASIHWWGNKFIATRGGRVDGFLFDVQKGYPRRQLMGPTHGKYGFGRDGKLWWAAGEDRTKPATVYVVDALDPAALGDGDDYEQIEELGKEYFLRRLWLEPGGVLRQPMRDDPPLKQKLIRRP